MTATLALARDQHVEILLRLADTLGIAYKTVANNCSMMKVKLGVERTADLIRLAVQNLQS